MYGLAVYMCQLNCSQQHHVYDQDNAAHFGLLYSMSYAIPGRERYTARELEAMRLLGNPGRPCNWCGRRPSGYLSLEVYGCDLCRKCIYQTRPRWEVQLSAVLMIFWGAREIPEVLQFVLPLVAKYL